MAEFLGFDGPVTEVLEPIFLVFVAIGIYLHIRDTYLTKKKKK